MEPPAKKETTPEILPATALEKVARCLYEAMEQLDPGTGDFVEWRDLPERDQEFYALTVRRLMLRKQELLELLSNHNMIAGHVEKGEKPDGD